MNRSAIALACAATTLAPLAADAAEVTMRLKGGGYQISGTLKSFDRNRYVIVARPYGTLSFDARRFDCIGTGCANILPVTPASFPTVARPNPVHRGEQFSIHGSKTIGTALMPALIRGYAQSRNGNVTPVIGADPSEVQFRFEDTRGAVVSMIDVQRRGSATAFTGLESGAAMFGMSDRPIQADEAAKLKPGAAAMRTSEHEHVIGLDGVVIIASPESSVTSLSLDQLAQIFSGRVKDWSELDLPAGKINVHLVDKNHGTLSIIENAIMRPRQATFSPDATIIANYEEMAASVANDPNAIGVTSLAYIGDAKPVNIEMSCGLVSRPNTFAVKNGEYPLARNLYLYTAGPVTQSSARGLLSFIKSPAAQPILKQSNFIDQEIESLSIGNQAGRIAYALNAATADFDLAQMRRMLAELNDAQRLSITFRFASGSSELDARSQQDLAKLARIMTAGTLRGKTVTLVGFTDPVGNLNANITLSHRRAGQVRANLLKQIGARVSPKSVVASGYGPLAPVACNDTVDGYQSNRRVEVWVK